MSIFAADQFDWKLFFLLTLHSECFAVSKTCKLHYDLQVLAEMVGTFLLLFCVCGIVACTQILRGQVGLMEYASVAGLTIIVVIFSIGSISGAHVNPAVTIAFATFGHFPWSKVKNHPNSIFWYNFFIFLYTNLHIHDTSIGFFQVPLYILAQTVGSVSATYVGSSVYGVKTELMTTRPAIGCSSAFWVEFMATFMLMFLAASLTSQSRSVRQIPHVFVSKWIVLFLPQTCILFFIFAVSAFFRWISQSLWEKSPICFFFFTFIYYIFI